MPKLYLLTNEDPLPLLRQKLRIALDSGAIDILQIRRKNTPIDNLPNEIEQIIALAQPFNVPIVINDNLSLAKRFGAGVHLGQSDGSIELARRTLGNTAMIGRTCHTSLGLIKTAIHDNASYVAIGAVFSSTTKPNASPLLFSPSELDELSALCQQGLNLCIIGGITLNNLSLLSNKLPNIRPTYIALSHDILGKNIDEIGEHCQNWQNALDNLYKK